jgi:iron complex outermembrane receptor protein
MRNYNTKSGGIELLLKSATFGNIFSCNLNTTVMRTWQEQTDGSYKRYKDSPEIILNGGINLAKYGFDLALMGKYVSEYIGDRFVIKTSPDQEVFVGNYANLDISLSYSLPKTPVTLYGRVRNLTDNLYSSISPVYPDYGRQFSIGLRLDIKH